MTSLQAVQQANFAVNCYSRSVGNTKCVWRLDDNSHVDTWRAIDSGLTVATVRTDLPYCEV